MDWSKIDAAVSEKSLLNHPFYQAWSAGRLTIEDLKYYAVQYYHMEKAFPRFLSRVHSNCDVPETRQAILENMIDEERGEENHRELWLRFCEGLGLNREEVVNSAPSEKTKEAIAALSEACSKSPAEGLAALYAYESQFPKVSESKIAGLEKFYGIKSTRALSFFETHKVVDAWHSQSERNEIERLKAPESQTIAGAQAGALALLAFLDGVEKETLGARGECAAC